MEAFPNSLTPHALNDRLSPSVRFRYDGPTLTKAARRAMNKRITGWNAVAKLRDDARTEAGIPPLRWAVYSQTGATLDEGLTEAGREDSLAVELAEIERRREGWESQAWLQMNPSARSAAGRELHPVEIEILVPSDAAHGYDLRLYRPVVVEIFTETGSSPWDAEQWAIDHPEDDGLDSRIAELASDVRTPGSVHRTEIDGEELTFFAPERPKVDVIIDANGKRRFKKRASGAALKNYRSAGAARQARRVEAVALANKLLLVAALKAQGIDPHRPDVVEWVNNAKRKANGRDGLAYARCLQALSAQEVAA